MSVPQPWEFALLALAAFRVFKLLADDTILDRPRAWTVKRLGDYWETFLLCPWCFGFHASWVLWLFWQWQPEWTLVVCTPLALSATLGLIATNLDD